MRKAILPYSASVNRTLTPAYCCPAATDPFIAPVEIPTPRIYPKVNITGMNTTGNDLGGVNMTAMTPAQKQAMVQKTITKAQSMVASITNAPPAPTVVLSSTPAPAAAPTPAVDPTTAGKTAVSVCNRRTLHNVPSQPPVFCGVERHTLPEGHSPVTPVCECLRQIAVYKYAGEPLQGSFTCYRC